VAKVAQLLAYQVGPGAADDEVARRALAALWDRAPGADPKAIRDVIAKDLGAPPEELFASWDDVPLAAASLGEVHPAVTRDGVAVAVKVQYPGVADALRSDLESKSVLHTLAGAELGGALSKDALETLRRAVLGELDYRAEAAAQERNRIAFLSTPGIRVPRVLSPLSSKRVLTAERIAGRQLAAFAAEASPEDRARVALTIFRFALGGPLRHRLLNADPNPGNYLVLDDGRVGFLDFGCTIELDRELVENDLRMWQAILAGDGGVMRAAIVDSGLVTRMPVLDSNTFREWERVLAAPFLVKKPFAWTGAHARRLAELTNQLVHAGGMTLPANALLLWRQRLGVAAVLGMLDATADFRGALAELAET
jgi:predicted unusual protein kinase regulating ubiquinone biosynthesis (AarF/ABC1/UbiB family)